MHSPVVATFRLYEELNDFIARDRRRREFDFDCATDATIKHVTEALGVPHTEVELILANGVSVDFARRLRQGDHVSGYPKSEAVDISPPLRLRPYPLRVTRFVADAHLGGPARLPELNGLLDIVPDPAVPGKGRQSQRMVATPWGRSASATYLQSFGYSSTDLLERLFDPTGKNLTRDELEAAEETQHHPFLLWASRALPLFPNCRHYLGDPESVEPFRGNVTFKVSLGPGVWRRIVMPAKSDFDDLARFILEAFQFDHEHLCQFRYRDEYANHRTFNDPRCSDVEDDYADEVTLGEAGLFPRQLVEFRYDLGDDWRFGALVERLDVCETGAKPTVLANKGKAPRP